MAFRYKLLIIVFFIACIGTASAYYFYRHVPLVEFRPVHMGIGQELETSNKPLTEDQADRVEAVLRKYSERFRRPDRTTILITPELSRDQELVWNYTTKAGVD